MNDAPPKITLEQAVATVAGWMRVLLAKDQVSELRAIKVKKTKYERPHTEGGFFDYDHAEQMARVALEVSPHAKAVYFTINPLKIDILARRAYRLDYADEGEQAADKDVIRRRWLFVDADPARDSLVSSTDGEKAEAYAFVLAVRDYLRGRGWPDPILGDSGNGYHLMYRIDLPADDNGTVQKILKALAARFDCASVHIDQKVFNAGRVCKFPGTVARKGDSIPERPHRRAVLLEVPNE